MKTLTSLVVAAALIAPAAASAAAGSRINTPGTEERHEANLSDNSDEETRATTAKAKVETAEDEPRKTRYRAALAGRVNVAKRIRD